MFSWRRSGAEEEEEQKEKGEGRRRVKEQNERLRGNDGRTSKKQQIGKVDHLFHGRHPPGEG